VEPRKGRKGKRPGNWLQRQRKGMPQRGKKARRARVPSQLETAALGDRFPEGSNLRSRSPTGVILRGQNDKGGRDLEMGPESLGGRKPWRSKAQERCWGETDSAGQTR
jgi:hypothetical protein